MHAVSVATVVIEVVFISFFPNGMSVIVDRPTNRTSNCYCAALNADSNFYVFLLYTAYVRYYLVDDCLGNNN